MKRAIWLLLFVSALLFAGCETTTQSTGTPSSARTHETGSTVGSSLVVGLPAEDLLLDLGEPDEIKAVSDGQAEVWIYRREFTEMAGYAPDGSDQHMLVEINDMMESETVSGRPMYRQLQVRITETTAVLIYNGTVVEFERTREEGERTI